MKIALASDHAGYAFKQAIKSHLTDRGHEVVDLGADSAERCDYPLFIRPAAEALGHGKVDRAIVLGGSGNGEAIVANRVPGVRCALCWNDWSARMGRAHNHANCIAIGERTMDLAQALRIVDIFLDTPFEGGRHERRIRQIDAE
jgi:ribose 5-phosphate isomerase B